jgi:hypothetical protein
MRRLETAEMGFVTAFVGHRMTDHKRNEDIRKEMRLTEGMS